MTIAELKPGRYIIAVSGGVDSMTLLDILRRQPDVELVVAHFDHGVRSDSRQDRRLVQNVALSHNLFFVYEEGKLGAEASEATAREARYNFLRHTRINWNARAIITAHHRDDLIETATINLLRGTGWRGLSSLASTPEVLRPLLATTKAELLVYARQHRLLWREDSTNADQRYLRNYVRRQLLPKMPAKKADQLYEYIVRQSDIIQRIDAEMAQWLAPNSRVNYQATALPRYQIVMVASNVAQEALQAVLRRASGQSMTRPQAGRAVLFCKVAKHGKVFPVNARWRLRIFYHEVIVEPAPDVVS